MFKLVVLDLSNVDLNRFEEYEKQVIPLLEQYGGRLEKGLRSFDGLTETHILFFPDQASFDEFLLDPVRASLQDEWREIGASASVEDVNEITYLK